MTTSNTLRMTFTTTAEGEYFMLSLNYAKPALKTTGGLATVQTAATAIIAQQHLVKYQGIGYVGGIRCHSLIHMIQGECDPIHAQVLLRFIQGGGNTF